MLEQNDRALDPTGETLREENNRYRNLLDNIRDVVYTTDSRGVVTYVNAAVERIAGYKSTEVIGRSFTDFVYEKDRDDRLQHFLRALSGEGNQTEYRYVTKSGDIRWVVTTGFVYTAEDGTVEGIQGVLTDITHLKKMQQELEERKRRYARLSITDNVTGLYNSRHFDDQLEEEMGRCRRYGHPLSLLMVDIDDFKSYNDTHGHIEGNRVLKELGTIMGTAVRSVDSVYRYGGDEFTVILPEATGEQAMVVARRIMDTVRESEVFALPERGTHLSISIGVAQSIPTEEKAEFIKRADMNMYDAKAQGKHGISFRHR